MKIEMGESLFYSWLRHVKECQIVQTNWKTSPQWTLLHQDELEEVMAVTSRFFEEKYGYSIYKRTSSLSQLLQQAECDAMGIAFNTTPSSPAFLHDVTAFDVPAEAQSDDAAGFSSDDTAGSHSVDNGDGSADGHSVVDHGGRRNVESAGSTGPFRVYAVDVAFHEAGLNYGGREKTVMKILAKSLRTAMCIYGYLDSKDAEVIFASPKIGKKKLTDLDPCINDAQKIMDGLGYHFRFRVIANEDFREQVLKPILLVSGGVADTNELFMRGYQMLQMFDTTNLDHSSSDVGSTATDTSGKLGESGESGKDAHSPDGIVETENHDGVEISGAEEIEAGGGRGGDAYAELKIGQLARTVMRRILESGRVPTEEIQRLQDKEYSKDKLHLNFPALIAEGEPFDRVRYYAEPLVIKCGGGSIGSTAGGSKFYLCSQWSECPENNDRPYILKWIGEHG